MGADQGCLDRAHVIYIALANLIAGATLPSKQRGALLHRC